MTLPLDYAQVRCHAAAVTDDEATRLQALGAALAEARRVSGKSVRSAAKDAKLSEGQWRVMERGYRQVAPGLAVPANPRDETLIAAGEAVRADVAELFSILGRPMPQGYVPPTPVPKGGFAGHPQDTRPVDRADAVRQIIRSQMDIADRLQQVARDLERLLVDEDA